LLLGLLVWAVLAYPTFSSVSTALGSIEVVRTELNGLPPIALVEELAQSLQNHRTESGALIRKDMARASSRAMSLAEVDKHLSTLSGMAESTDDRVLKNRFIEVKNRWVTLKAEIEAGKLDERQSLAKHTALIEGTIAMVQDWTAYSTIDLDPDAATYYTFRAVLVDLPRLKESIRALRSPVSDRLEDLAKAKTLGTGADADAAIRDAWRLEDKARFLTWIAQGEAATTAYADDMRKAMAGSALIKAQLGDQVTQLTQLSERAMAYARKELFGQDIPAVDPVAYAREVSGARALAIKQADMVKTLLITELEQREAKANRDLYITIGITLGFLTLGLTLAVLIINNITGTVARLQASVDKVRAGDDAALGNIEAKDEVGDLGRTVNTLLLERIASQKVAEAENEGLNNSVIAVLQTVYQLSQRDLTVRAPVTSDMVGTVSDSINGLTDETVRVLSEVNGIAANVADASRKVQAQANQVSKTAEDERASVGVMVRSLTEATTTMGQVSALASETNSSAAQASLATDSALEAVNATVKGMEAIRETIAETEKRIKRLGERSQEISGIVNLINTIAERTHVLALNAAMQAAVAGDAGRGFAVVAEEVQRLAESSRTATQQIGTLVGNIQLETNETINTVNRTIGQVVQGSEQSVKAGEQMRRTQEITQQLVAQVRRIGDATEVQKTMSEHLLTAMQNIGVSSERTSDQINAQNVETESLLDSSRQLVASVNQFKLPQVDFDATSIQRQ
jgi:methyl-accepting chemotaxis protein